MVVYVALLRGINVGGSGKLPMADLRDVFSDAGGSEVQTYIQSGNVVFRHRAASGDRLQVDLEHAIEAATGLEVPVVVRTRDELASVVEANPYEGVEPTKLHVAFLTADPAPGSIDRVDLERFLPEECVPVGREIYLHLPNGMGRAKLPNALAAIGTATTRNWRTVTTLLDLATA
jgi:uncharacterized protein (DUF1697 family)